MVALLLKKEESIGFRDFYSLNNYVRVNAGAFYAIMTVMKAKTISCITGILLFIILVLTVACSQVPGTQTASSPVQTVPLSLLFTNDVHAHLDNMPRLATAVQDIRRQAGKENVLLMDAGDAFSGSVYFKLYRGQAGLWFLNSLGYDAMCPGNHDFDDGLRTFSDLINKAGFKMVCANLTFPTGSEPGEIVTPWVILERNGQRYGILGLLTEETSLITGPDIDIAIGDPIAAARQAVSGLEKAGVNRIIALTHIGWSQDLELAKQVGDIDVIISGHSHTIPNVFPTVINEDGSPTLVAQAGDYGRYLGHLDVSFDQAGAVKDWTGSALMPLDEKTPEDPVYAAKLSEYKAPVQQMMDSVAGKTQVDLDGVRNNVRSRETNLGNLVADSMLSRASRSGAGIVIITGGGIRDSIPAGEISLAQIKSILPFDNYLVAFDISGRQILEALENGVSQVETLQGRFPQVAGLKFVWDPAAKPGSRIISAEVKKAGGFETLDPAATYRIATIQYLYQGGDGYSMFSQGANYVNLGYIDNEVLAEYVAANSPINPRVEGRIISR
jgi:2',3'-cyclic-nucleotide 2'-phosphodiesterase (5'-nucleotidase family)